MRVRAQEQEKKNKKNTKKEVWQKRAQQRAERVRNVYSPLKKKKSTRGGRA